MLIFAFSLDVNVGGVISKCTDDIMFGGVISSEAGRLWLENSIAEMVRRAEKWQV